MCTTESGERGLRARASRRFEETMARGDTQLGPDDAWHRHFHPPHAVQLETWRVAFDVLCGSIAWSCLAAWQPGSLAAWLGSSAPAAWFAFDWCQTGPTLLAYVRTGRALAST